MEVFFSTLLADPYFKAYYLFALAIAVPVGRIFQRAGFNPAWTFLLLVPDVGWILCIMLLGLRRWPATKKGA